MKNPDNQLEQVPLAQSQAFFKQENKEFYLVKSQASTWSNQPVCLTLVCLKMTMKITKVYFFKSLENLSISLY